MLCPAILLFLSTSLGYHVALCVSLSPAWEWDPSPNRSRSRKLKISDPGPTLWSPKLETAFITGFGPTA